MLFYRFSLVIFLVIYVNFFAGLSNTLMDLKNQVDNVNL